MDASRILTACFDRFLTLPAVEHIRLDPSEETLSGKDSTVYTSETGLEGALLLLDMHDQVTAVAGRTHKAFKLWAFCPKCHRLALEHEEGSHHVDCRKCGERMPYEKYQEMSSLLAQYHADDPVPERPKRTVELPPDEPIVWADGSEHKRLDTRSNMMLAHVERHTDEGESAA
jgi:Zn ribbon nucleic-acid-binding protein